MNDPVSDQPAPLDTRASTRDSLFLQAILRRSGDATGQLVRVRNLSPGGMMAEIGMPFARDDAIDITLNGLGDLRGTVIWRRADRIGIAFATPIDPRRARKAVAIRTAPPVAPLRTLRRPRLFGQ